MAVAKKTAVKKGVKGETPNLKYIAVVMETAHGHFLTAHKHYDVKVLQVPVGLTAESVEEAAQKACDLGRKVFGARGRVLTAQDIEINTTEDIKAGADKVRKILGFDIK